MPLYRMVVKGSVEAAVAAAEAHGAVRVQARGMLNGRSFWHDLAMIPSATGHGSHGAVAAEKPASVIIARMSDAAAAEWLAEEPAWAPYPSGTLMFYAPEEVGT